MKLYPINRLLLLEDMRASGKTDAAIIQAAGLSKQFFTKLRQKEEQEPTSMRDNTITRIAKALDHPVARYFIQGGINGVPMTASPVFSKVTRKAPVKNERRVEERRVNNGNNPAIIARAFLGLSPEEKRKTVEALKLLGCL
jgi:hypothetical protein